MADSSFPINRAPDTAEVSRGQQLATAPADAPGATGSAMLACSTMLAGGAALAVLALVFLMPRIGGRFARWQSAAPGTRRRSLLRDR